MTLQFDDDLVFLVSQPRAGSTMLQSILAAHTDIYTTSECWLMLLPLTAWRNGEIEASYNHATWCRAVDAFFEEAGLRRETYFKGVSQMGRTVYNAVMRDRKEQIFVDKTPRYGYVLPELANTFQEAKFIVLLRNPVAVLTSILSTFLPDQEYGLSNFEKDLFDIPKNLLGAADNMSQRVVTTRYEDLLETPEKEIRILSDFLGVKSQPEMLNYGKKKETSWQLGDPNRVDEFGSPNSERSRAWVDRLEDAQVWRLAKNYAERLGEEVFGDMGYDYEEIRKLICAYEPSVARRLFTSSLESCLSKDMTDRSNLEKTLRVLRNGIRERRVSSSLGVLFKKVGRWARAGVT